MTKGTERNEARKWAKKMLKPVKFSVEVLTGAYLCFSGSSTVRFLLISVVGIAEIVDSNRKENVE